MLSSCANSTPRMATLASSTSLTNCILHYSDLSSKSSFQRPTRTHSQIRKTRSIPITNSWISASLPSRLLSYVRCRGPSMSSNPSLPRFLRISKAKSQYHTNHTSSFRLVEQVRRLGNVSWIWRRRLLWLEYQSSSLLHTTQTSSWFRRHTGLRSFKPYWVGGTNSRLPTKHTSHRHHSLTPAASQAVYRRMIRRQHRHLRV